MIAWFTRNGVAATLVMLILVIGGAVSYFTVKRELFPQFSLDLVTAVAKDMAAGAKNLVVKKVAGVGVVLKRKS